jgi:hypothetical protein
LVLLVTFPKILDFHLDKNQFVPTLLGNFAAVAANDVAPIFGAPSLLTFVLKFPALSRSQRGRVMRETIADRVSR